MELKPMAPLPETGFLRLPQIVGDPKAYPPTAYSTTSGQ